MGATHNIGKLLWRYKQTCCRKL